MTLAEDAIAIVDQLYGRPNVFALGPAQISREGATSSCSSFLSWLLQVVPRRAAEFGRQIKDGPIRRETDIRKVKAGDIGAIVYAQEREGMSGHCFFIMQKPGEIRRGEWMIEVVDSCRTSHGPGDTRYHAPGGIGRGYMVLLTDEKGIIQGYKWSNSPLSPRVMNSDLEEILIGVIP